MGPQSRAARVLAAVITEQQRQKMSNTQLAKRWGVPVHYMAARFSGKKGLTGSELGHIARALRVPVDQLAGE